ncbi:winged helix-turn-helix domain-containing protein [Paraglaciecola sp. 20A4]|uniref:winged helix-turn-helix domain-containing protein n=1 Tax=Paraglaciecola sp. 20A4 TaxID=2687288 RepID=UPI00140C9E61|nr:winged helix-turn-helix domain-containing protein [Paraglaciecola sp. 20A4]
MTYAQTQQGMLVISNDNFLVGLLTGFSVANGFYFYSLPVNNPLTVNSVQPICRVVLIDLRNLTPLLMRSHFAILQQVNALHGVPVCAIYDQNDLDFDPCLSWVSYFNDVDLIAQLDRYLTDLIASSANMFYERRSQERRCAIDRRGLAALSHATENTIGNLPVTNKSGQNDPDRFSLGPFRVNKNSRSVCYNSRDLALTGKEFMLFMLLAEVHDQVCSTERIIGKLWPDTRRANKSDLYQYMHLLRKKVEDDPEVPKWILTVKGVGYRLNTKELLL